VGAVALVPVRLQDLVVGHVVRPPEAADADVRGIGGHVVTPHGYVGLGGRTQFGRLDSGYTPPPGDQRKAMQTANSAASKPEYRMNRAFGIQKSLASGTT
jgi:hypothetical protein